MAVNGNNYDYDIVIKKEPDIDIEIIDHEIKEEPGDDYEDYLQNINNVIIKEEVILSDGDDDCNDYYAEDQYEFFQEQSQYENISNLNHSNGIVANQQPCDNLHSTVTEPRKSPQNVVQNKKLPTHTIRYATSVQDPAMQQKGQDLKFLCLRCGDSFFIYARYQEHLKSHLINDEEKKVHNPNMKVYSKLKLYQCTKCLKTFPSQEALSLHSYIHNQCDICNKRFESESSLNKHKESHIKAFQCDECDVSFDIKSYLDGHKVAVHKPRHVICKYCKKKFVAGQKYMLHLLNCNNSAEVNGSAPVQLNLNCSVQSNNSSIAQLFRRNNPIKCKLCKGIFTTLEELGNHVCPNEKPAKTENTLDNLINRTTSSTGVKLYECGLCRKQFHILATLKKHLKSHENKETSCEYPCGKCEKRFPSQKDLDEHSCPNENTQEEYSLEDLKTYLTLYNGLNMYGCVVCSKKFYTAQTFKTHLSGHSQTKEEMLQMKKRMESSDRLYECAQCKVRFGSEENLKMHIRYHNGKPPYKCEKCGKKNFTLASFRSHLMECSESKLNESGECKNSCEAQDGTENGNSLDLEGEDKEESNSSIANSFTCTECKLTFQNKYQWEKHVVHHKKYTRLWYKCDECPKVFKTLIGCNKHKILHTDFKPFECGKCPEKFHTRQALSYHSLDHLKDNTVGCMECGLKFPSEYKLMLHSRKHQNRRCFKCEKCGRTFVSHLGFKKHKSKCTGKIFECDRCDKFFTTGTSLKCHKKIHAVREKYICEKCKKQFTFRKVYENHLLIHEGVKPYKCERCGETFIIKSALRRHSVLHGKNLPFECQFCNEKFPTKRSLGDHVLIHPQAQPNKCDVCHRLFKLKSNLEKHLRLHKTAAKTFEGSKYEDKPREKSTQTHQTFAHLDLNGKSESEENSERITESHRCSRCSKMFTSKVNLKKHHFMIHMKSKPFECSVCNRRFPFKYALNVHFHLFHSFQKKFKCYVCRKQFKYKSSFTSHLMSHGMSTAYKCDYCKRKFFTKSELSEHIGWSHSNNRKNSKNRLKN